GVGAARPPTAAPIVASPARLELHCGSRNVLLARLGGGGPAMVDPRTRPISWTRFVLTLVLSLLIPACQNAMSIEEAKKVTATFNGAGFVPPPRTINDIVAI